MSRVNLEVKKANIQFHNEAAPYYDRIHYEGYNKFEQEYLQRRLSRLSEILKHDSLCLDLGCGTGNLTGKEVQFFDYVVGLDISLEMLKEGVKRVNGALFVQGECERLPFRDNSFSFVSMYGLVHHLLDIRLSVREVYRILKPGGVIFIGREPNARSNSLFLGSILKIAGFFGRRTIGKSLKFRPLINCSKEVEEKAEVRANEGIIPEQLKYILLNSGFSVVSITFRDYFMTLAAALSFPFNWFLLKVDWLLSKNSLMRKISLAIEVVSKKPN